MSTQPQNTQLPADKEVRSVSHAIEVRKNSDGSRTIAGTAVVYNSLSEDLGFREQIAPGAFTRSLRENPDVFILYDHDMGQVLGRVSSGTATVTDTPTELNFTCKLGNTSFAKDVIDMAERGDVRGVSFGFTAVSEKWSALPDGTPLRTVTEAILYEASIVSSPAYTKPSFNVRAALRNCPLELKSKLTPAPDSSQGEEKRCGCTCGLTGCASLDVGSQNADGVDANLDELGNRALLISLLTRRMTS